MNKLFFFLLFITTFATAQTPRSYTTFEQKSSGNATNFKDSTGLFDMSFAAYVPNSYTWNTTGAVGRSVTLGDNNSLILASSSSGSAITGSFTFEFIVKFGKKYHGGLLFQCTDGSYSGGFNVNDAVYSPAYGNYTIDFSTTTGGVTDEWMLNLDGIGRKSLTHYVDDDWHHYAFVYNAATGVKQIWVDGQLPTGFSKTVTAGNLNSGADKTIRFNSTVPYRVFNGSIDEYAYWNSALSNVMIYQHYQNFINGQHYQYSTTITSVPAAAAVTAAADTMDYPPTGMTALNQLYLSPAPRYKPGHTLNKQFNWVDMVYFGGRFQPGVSDAQSKTRDTVLQLELCKNWNYMIYCTAGNDQWSIAEQQFGNKHPEYLLSTITKRAQLNPATKLTNQTLVNSAYLQNSGGAFLNRNCATSATKYWSPASAPSLFATDGQTQKGYLAYLRSQLTRPVNFVNENGEVIAGYDDCVLNLDPNCVSQKNASGLSMQTWQGRNFAREETQSYFSAFTGDFPGGTKFTYYALDGFPQFRFKYDSARVFQSQFNSQWYSTVDYYPKRCAIWRMRNVAFNGMQWLLTGRNYEIAAGDRMFSPFVAAGWDPGSESQWIQSPMWIGLMKNLVGFGTDFFYTGFFNEAGNYNPPNPAPLSPDLYAYQLTIPTYAQAIGSRAGTLLTAGTLQCGDVPQSYDPPEAGCGNSFWCGDPQVYIVARNLGSKYLITASYNQIVNMKGAVFDQRDVTFTMGGTDYTIQVRRQGSTYILDKTVTPNLFYQLDGWHEASNPNRWTKDFNLEAELYDNTNKTFPLLTNAPTAPNYGSNNFTTYISYADTATVFDTIKYNFQPRTDSTYWVWVRLRSRTGASTGCVVSVNAANAKTISGVTSTSWYYYRYASSVKIKYVHVDSIVNEFQIKASNKFLEFDKFTLTPDSTLTFPEDTTTTPCGVITATITTTPSTTICSGQTAVLTANLMNSYVWSTGATTRAINVTTAGTYTVTVYDPSACSGTSSGTAITVNTTPNTPIINAGGTTTFCSGGSVVLTSSSAANNTWSTGATTQAITASTSGTYTVTVTVSGCSATSTGTVVTVNANPSTPTITASGATTFCSGGSVTLTAPVSTTYLWSSAQTSRSIVVSTAGTYTVTVSNASTCTAASAGTAVTVNAVPSVPVITPSGATTFCSGGSVTLTSTAATSYLWSTGAVTQAIAPTVSGTYIVTVTNAGGCTSTSAPTTVTVNPTPTAVITANGPTNLCTGGSVTLSANTSTSYLWSTGATTQSINVSTAATYTVTVTQSSCTSPASNPVTVTVSSSPVPTITPSSSTTFCQGSSITLTSSAGTSYLWSTGATTQGIVVSASGNYTVSVTTGTCSGVSVPTTVTVNPVPTATVTPSGTVSFCSGGSRVLTANAATSYLWNTGATTQSITVSTAGSYFVKVTTNGCQSANSASTVINVVTTATPTITPSAPTTFCQGDSINLTSSSATSYQWSTGAVTQAIKVKTAGTYTVTVTTSSCSATSAGTVVTVNSRPSPIITYTGAQNPCNGDSVLLTSNYASGNVWSTGAVTQTVYVKTTATYSLTVTQSLCSATATRNVVFTDCGSCTAPTGLVTTDINRYNCYIAWNAATGANNYIVTVTRKSTGNTKVTTMANVTTAKIKYLYPNSVYQVKIQTVCGTTPSGYSTTLEFKTNSW